MKTNMLRNVAYVGSTVEILVGDNSLVLLNCSFSNKFRPA